jgi:hypothetical protein
VYVEETGPEATDTTDENVDASAETMTVTVEGEEYEVDTNYDVDQDGNEETALVESEDGSAIAFSDTNADGAADLAVELDAQGNVVGAAQYDEASGDWVAVDPGAGQVPGGPEPVGGAPAGGEINVDLPGADQSAGPATLDVNSDGVADTAVVQSEDGTVTGFTDINGDGQADVVTTFSPDGHVSVAEHTGQDQWTEVVSGTVDEQGNYIPDAGADQPAGGAPKPVSIDPATGNWVS